MIDNNITNSNLEFRKIKSLNFLYEINSNGTIFRNVKSKKQNKIILDHHHSEKGYYVTFIHVGGRRPGNYTKRIMIHTIVAECWLGDRPEGYEIDHIDRDSTNNDYRNLRYVTRSEQMKNRTLGAKMIERATQNCMNYVKTISHPVQLENQTEKISKLFPSKLKAAEFIYSNNVDNIKNVESVYSRLKKKRSHIFGYDVIYLNAETRHDDATA